MKINKSVEEKIVAENLSNTNDGSEESSSCKVAPYTRRVFNNINLDSELKEAKEINKLSKTDKEEYKNKSKILRDTISRKTNYAEAINEKWTNNLYVYKLRIPLRYKQIKQEEIKNIDVEVDKKVISKEVNNIKFIEPKEVTKMNEATIDTLVIDELNAYGTIGNKINTISKIENTININEDCSFNGISFLQDGFKAVDLQCEYVDKNGQLIWKREYKDKDKWNLTNGNKLKISYNIESEVLNSKALPSTYCMNLINFDKYNQKYYLPFEINITSKSSAKDLLMRSKYNINVGDYLNQYNEIDSLLWKDRK